jgi:hypothetical protein
MLTSYSTLNQRIYRKILTNNLNKPLHLLHRICPQYTSSSHDIIEKSPSQVLTAPSSAAETPNSSVPRHQWKRDHQQRKERQLAPPTIQFGPPRPVPYGPFRLVARPGPDRADPFA